MAEVIDEVTQTASPEEATSSPTPTPTKKRRFRFTTELDRLMCKVLSETRAHVPPVNRKTELMNEACALFISLLPRSIRDTYMEPKGKTLSDRFDLIANQRREENKINQNASGITEEQTELNVLLDDLIHQRDEMEEGRRKKRDEKTAMDKKLDDAAKEVRIHATSRMSSKSSANATDDEPEKKKRKVVTIDSDDEELELLKESLAERRENERKRMVIERERLDMEKDQARLNAAKVKKEQELEEKRIAIEEARVDIERQKAFADLAERRAGIEERKAMAGAFSSIAKNLGQK